VKLFRVAVSTNRTDYVATNDLSQSSTNVVQEVCKVRWEIEEFHREIKQISGIGLVNVVKLGFKEIILLVQCWFGLD
jgi:hypothetical protein